MISEEAKSVIDALSKDDLRLEVNKGHQSRFQGDKFAYAKARLQKLGEAEQAAQHEADLTAATNANEIARKANILASEANAISKRAWWISVISLVVATIAMIVSMCAKN